MKMGFEGLLLMFSAYIWWYYIHPISTCWGMFVQHVHIFHTVLLALQPVAAGIQIPGMNQGKATQNPPKDKQLFGSVIITGSNCGEYHNFGRPHQGIHRNIPLSRPARSIKWPARRQDVLGVFIYDYYRNP
jgi:hypothetical protein